MWSTRAHPRVCGATGSSGTLVEFAWGSSPRVRGDLPRREPCSDERGLIPACAGRPLTDEGGRCRSRAHPRVCGATDSSIGVPAPASGSSPRVRGDRGHASATPRHRGLIPACAGRPRSPPHAGGSRRAHPRVCGATWALSSFCRTTTGSSPRVRGDPARGCGPCRGAGLIPACAGRPRPDLRAGRRRWAHPRVCGATLASSRTETRRPGSSPRVRGDLPPHHRRSEGRGLIPACAGRPGHQDPLRRDARAHPRVCGATRPPRPSWALSSGSSPRVRGDPSRHLHGWQGEGLIPACAGRPVGFGTSRPTRRAHPRVCGATTVMRSPAVVPRGSSPRVRGDQRAGVRAHARDGLIPACAGRPLTLDESRLLVKAHPRVCGATARNAAATNPDRGSSPRVRGDHAHADDVRGARGLIPACAGRPRGRWRRRRCRRAHPRVCGATGMRPSSTRATWGSSPRVRGDLRR